MQGTPFTRHRRRNTGVRFRLDHARPTWSGLLPGGEYEWYVTVNDGTVDDDRAGVELHRRERRRTTPPVAVNDAYTSPRTATLTSPIAGVLGNDTDADDDSLTAILVAGAAARHAVAERRRRLHLHAGRELQRRSTASPTRPTTALADRPRRTVSITITPVNDAPVAADDSYTVDEDTPLTVGDLGVLANDNDPDGDALTAVLLPRHRLHGVLLLNSDGTVTYTPLLNYTGPDAFSYKANDGHGRLDAGSRGDHRQRHANDASAGRW